MKKETAGAVELLVIRFNELLKCLETERAALIAHDGQALDACVAHKQALCASIAEGFAAAPELTAELQRAAGGPDGPDELDEDHKTLLELAIAARDYNLVNGKILHRSQQSVREILGILSGKSLDGLYGQSGQQSAVPASGGQAIARV